MTIIHWDEKEGEMKFWGLQIIGESVLYPYRVINSRGDDLIYCRKET